MLRTNDIDGAQPNKFNHSKRGYAQPVESPYNSFPSKVAPLTNNIFNYSNNPIANTYSPTTQNFYRNSPTKTAQYEIQQQINSPNNANAMNQKHLVDEEIFQRQRGKGALAIDQRLNVVERFDPTKLRGPAYYNHSSASNLNKKANLNDSLDNFQTSYSIQNSAGYQKNLENFFGYDGTRRPAQQQFNNTSSRARVTSNERNNLGFGGQNLNSSFGSQSPSNKNHIQFGLERTQQNIPFVKEKNTSHLIQQKTLNRTWAEAQYAPTNPITHQESVNPVSHKRDGYFAKPNYFGNGVHNQTYKAR